MNMQQLEKFPVKKVQVNGTTLSYTEQGSGEPLVFIHGALSDYRTWREQCDALAGDFRVISYSRRGHYPNARAADADYTRAVHTADLVEFLNALKLENAHLVGHSYGASLALLAALRQPALVGSLILGEPSPFPELFDEASRALLAEQKAGFNRAARLAKIGEKNASVREFLHTVVGIDAFGLLPDERRAAVLENADTLLPMLASYYDSPPVGERFRQIKVPVLLVTGEISPVIARVANKMIARQLPNSRIAVLKGASHGLQMENPEGFLRLAADFLAVNKKTAPLDEKSLLLSPIFNQKFT